MPQFDYLIRGSLGWAAFFIVLTALSVVTQFWKETRFKWIPYQLRAVIKAGPALFLTGLSWSLGYPLIAALFLFCSIGDILLDLPENKFPLAFEIGAISFAAALVCVCIASYHNPMTGRILMPLMITNFVIALFVIRWVLPMMKGLQRVLEVCYFAMLLISNGFASSSTIPVFLGSSLWFMSDLSIGLGAKVDDDPANSLDTLGLYAVGLYFLAVGFLNA